MVQRHEIVRTRLFEVLGRPGVVVALGLVVAGITGCEALTDPQPDTLLPAASPTGPADPSGGSGPPGPTTFAATAPPDYPGTGPLARRVDVPATSPLWTTVLASIEVDGENRYLWATGVTRGITNRELARRSAENRARAELSRWLGSERLVGSEVVDVWADPLFTIAKVRVPLAEGWKPAPNQPIFPPD